LRLLNRSLTLAKLQELDHAILRDESHNFRLKTYYIRPTEQLRQLTVGFSNVKVFSWSSGLELTSKAALDINTDMWLYYLCTIS